MTIGRVLIAVDTSGSGGVSRGRSGGGEEALGIDATVGAMMRRSSSGGTGVSRGGTGDSRGGSGGGTGARGIDATAGVTTRRPCSGAAGTGTRSLTKSIMSR